MGNGAMTASKENITALLAQAQGGKQEKIDQLMQLLYGELRRLAASYLRRERIGHTLQPTALVNEAYLRLVEQDGTDWKNRSHFLAIAAQAMRRVLVDHARRGHAAKRGGPLPLAASSTPRPEI
jgi:RNA polymerase sigma-70 factor, ECF subfamily